MQVVRHSIWQATQLQKSAYLSNSLNKGLYWVGLGFWMGTGCEIDMDMRRCLVGIGNARHGAK